jgi:hybrid cluster-associated redox disulfide protein
METPLPDIHSTVDDILQRWPHAISVFLKRKTKCPGCYMQNFCTLKEVAETYRISPEELMAEIESVSES